MRRFTELRHENGSHLGTRGRAFLSMRDIPFDGMYDAVKVNDNDDSSITRKSSRSKIGLDG